MVKADRNWFEGDPSGQTWALNITIEKNDSKILSIFKN